MRTFATAIVVSLIMAIGVVGQTLDPTFGSGGTVRTDFSGNIDQANAVAIQPDGKIVAAGSSFSSSKTVEDFVVARYNTNGTLDKRFGNNGKITTDFFRNVDSIEALAIQPDGKIVVAGFAQLAGAGGTPRVFALARYTSDGRLDSSFGSGGSLTTSFGGTFAVASAVMVQPDGKIVVAGTADFNPRVPGSGLDFALARYNANGTLDASFGDAGKIVFDFFGSFDQANAAALQPDGKIIVVGSASYDSLNRDIGFALTRFNADGSTDFGFASGGKQITSFFDAGAKANDIVLQPDGRFVVAGTASDSATRPVATDFALARYNSDGTLDSSFGAGGETAVPFSDSATEQANALALMADGGIIVAGNAFKTFSTPPDFALRRYNTDGTIDTSFGNGGVITTDFAGGTDEALAVAIQADGNVIVAGRAFRSNFDLALARYRNDVAPTIDVSPPTA
ncbi:MAG TPA: delta-60 repeat domain-containing protein, partial [Pyrinomonadaceae bacterium]|nr:delta-60 repeat domain-containing protein [Pyrinomonadaceae bacterium]